MHANAGPLEALVRMSTGRRTRSTRFPLVAPRASKLRLDPAENRVPKVRDRRSNLGCTTVLLVQATAAMVVAGSQFDRHGPSRFRHSFLLAYASRIGVRLRAAEAASRAAATEEYGEALLPVLADPHGRRRRGTRRRLPRRGQPIGDCHQRRGGRVGPALPILSAFDGGGHRALLGYSGDGRASHHTGERTRTRTTGNGARIGRRGRSLAVVSCVVRGTSGRHGRPLR